MLTVGILAAAGCAVPQSSHLPAPAGITQSTVALRTKSPHFLLYCASYRSDCGVVSASGDQVATITSGLYFPAGIAVGKVTGHWYIANNEAPGIVVYSLDQNGQPTPIGSVADATGQFPGDIALFEKGNRSKLAISNTQFTDGQTASLYVVPSKGQPLTLTVSGARQGEGVAFDSKGNCYWSYSTQDGVQNYIVEFQKCAGDPQMVYTKTGIQVGSLAVDRHDNLWFTTPTEYVSFVYKCVGNLSCTAAFTGFKEAVDLGFDSESDNLFVADAGNSVIDECPVSGTTCLPYFYTPASDPPFSVAVFPAPKR